MRRGNLHLYVFACVCAFSCVFVHRVRQISVRFRAASPWSLESAPCIVRCVPCTVHCSLCTVHCALCIVPWNLSGPHALCTALWSLGTTRHTVPLSNATHKKLNALNNFSTQWPVWLFWTHYSKGLQLQCLRLIALVDCPSGPTHAHLSMCKLL